MTTTQIPQVDINRSSLEDLIAVNGIGPSLAEKIIAYRPFQTLHDLVNIPGINERKLALLLPYLSIAEKEKSTKLPQKAPALLETPEEKPITKVGDTEAFVFLEDKNERQDALLMIFSGFIIGLLILLLRRSRQ